MAEVHRRMTQREKLIPTDEPFASSEAASPYLDYPGKPVILGDPKILRKQGRLQYLADGRARINLSPGEFYVIPPDQQFNRVETTIAGLLEDLVPGSSLADKFYEEAYTPYEQSQLENPDRPGYGAVVYYPQRKDLVLYAPAYWHQISLLTRNSLLLRDAEQSIDWEKQREAFSRKTIGVAGASVGKNAFLRIIDTLRPGWVKIADPSFYKDTNANRTDLAYWEIGQNKAIISAQQAHRADPYMNISVYQNGIYPGEIESFILGEKKNSEPPIDILVEETDDLETKVMLFQKARQHRKPVFMITDLGAAYQLDFRNFRDDPDLSLAYGVGDDDLLSSLRKWQEDRADRTLFFDFAFKLIGQHWREVPEFKDLVLKNVDTPFGGGIPQLGIAAHAGASHGALMVADFILRNALPERTFNNMRARQYTQEGILS